MKPYISVVIPVHNGTKFLPRTIKGILAQTMRNVEIILIENGSCDDSFALCQSFAHKYPNVRAYQSSEKGTSLARKMGVELAVGEYIVFSDQDDSFSSKHALQKMYDAVTEDRAQICQFGRYQKYLFGLRRRIRLTTCNKIINRDKMYADMVKGVTAAGGCFDTFVWSKIYESTILKNAVKHITQPLFFAEDMNLNIHAFFDPGVERVSVRAEEYYAWNVGVGFSSNPKNGYILFNEYSVVKTAAVKLLEENGCSQRTLYESHLESMYFLKAYVVDMLERNEQQQIILSQIAEMKEYDHVLLAKQYLRTLSDRELHDELRFLISDYTPEEFLQWCIVHKPKKTFIKRMYGMLRLIKK